MGLVAVRVLTDDKLSVPSGKAASPLPLVAPITQTLSCSAK